MKALRNSTSSMNQQRKMDPKQQARRSFEFEELQQESESLDPFSLKQLGTRSNQPKLQPITASKEAAPIQPRDKDDIISESQSRISEEKIPQSHSRNREPISLSTQYRKSEEKTLLKSPRNRGSVNDGGAVKKNEHVKLVSLPQKHRRSSAYSNHDGDTNAPSMDITEETYTTQNVFKKQKSRSFEEDVENLVIPQQQPVQESEETDDVGRKLSLREFLNQKGNQQSILNNLDPNNNNLQIADFNDHINTEALRYNHQVRNQQIQPNAYITIHNVQNSLGSVKQFKVREMSPYMLEIALNAADAIQEGINLHCNGWNVGDIIDIAQHSVKLHPKGILNDKVRRELRESDHESTREHLRQLQTLQVKNTNSDVVKFSPFPIEQELEPQPSLPENNPPEKKVEPIKECSPLSSITKVDQQEIGSEGVGIFFEKLDRKLRQHLSDLLSVKPAFQSSPICFNLKEIIMLDEFQKDEDGEIRRSLSNSVPAEYKKDVKEIIKQGKALLENKDNSWILKKQAHD